MCDINVIIISGISGSGKSTALKTLEDLGFFCVDNLPILLLPKFIELCTSSTHAIRRIGLVMDVREKTFLKEYGPTVQALKDSGCMVEQIFLDCSDDTIVKRFSETRRQHPLGDATTVREGLTRERELLSPIKASADRVLDTSSMNVHQLRTLLEDIFAGLARRSMTINFLSFGYKYGVPVDVDLVMDVRFLPNPYFVNSLKDLSGGDKRVAAYVLQWPETQEFIQRFTDLLNMLIPLYEREGKSYLTVAIGCTGGRHRSVTLADCLHDFYREKRVNVAAIHRDIDR
jgi:RNase adapter protein RapZ